MGGSLFVSVVWERIKRIFSRKRRFTSLGRALRATWPYSVIVQGNGGTLRPVNEIAARSGRGADSACRPCALRITRTWKCGSPKSPPAPLHLPAAFAGILPAPRTRPPATLVIVTVPLIAMPVG